LSSGWTETAYVLRRYATTDELRSRATRAAKKSLQLKIIGTNTLYERFVKNWEIK